MENPIKMDDLGGKPTIFGNIHPGEFFFRSQNNRRVLASCGMYSGVATLKLSGASKEKAEPRSMKRTWEVRTNQPSRNLNPPKMMISTWMPDNPQKIYGALEFQMYLKKIWAILFGVYG